jgi:PAS domain S-box-containing protein
MMRFPSKFYPGRLAVRLAAYVILFSSAIATVITAFELRIEYVRDIRGIDSRMQEIKDAYLDSIVENVWIADRERIDTLLLGITRLPDFVLAEVKIAGETAYRHGRALHEAGTTRAFPLQRMHRGRLQDIGELVVSATYDNAVKRVLDRLLFFLVANGGKTLLVAFFIFFVFYWLIGRHIENIALHARNFSLDRSYEPIRLSSREAGGKDELQDVETAFNQMAGRLLSYKEAVDVREAELNRLNVELERKSAAERAGVEALRVANITLEERVEQRTAELKASEERLRKLSRAVEQNPNMIFITDANGSIEYVNAKFCELTGYSREEALGRNPRIFKSGETPPETYRDLWATILAGREWRGELQDRRKDGEMFWASLLISPIRNDQGVLTHFVAVHEDITGKKRNEQLLQRESTLRQMVIESLPGIFFLFSAQGRFVMWNRNLEAVMGMTTEEIARSAPTDYFEGDDRRLVEESIARVFAEGRASVEAVLVSKDRQRIPFHFSGVRFALDGEPCVVGTGFDISERRAAELAISHARDQALSASRTKSDFLANMSHELRTPLNAIIGFSDLMQSESFGPLGNPKYKGYARDINRSGAHLLELINDILDVSVIEAGKLELLESEQDIRKIVESVVPLIAAKAEANEISISVHMPDRLPLLRADSRRVKQILLNLLSNAVKFSPKGGTVLVKVAHDDGRGVSIAVSDNGVGMSKDEIRLAMTPFGRTKQAFIREIEGTGLGLPLCSSLIAAHGGTMGIESMPGSGTTVTVHFPPERVIRTTDA